MKWNLNHLVKLQKNLDAHVFKKANASYESTTAKRQMALVVELAEWANELRFFKFWSLKKQSSMETIFDEFADVLHFALSFAVQFNVDCVFETKYELEALDLISNFKKLMNASLLINDADNTLKFLQDLFLIAEYLNYQIGEIEVAYVKKNQVNMMRATSDY